MCEPVSLSLMAAAAVASAYQAKASARVQAKGAKFNAEMARLKREDAIQRGQQAEHIQRQKTSALVGHQRALIGASGAAVGEGVAAILIEDSLAAGEMNALQVRNNAAREAWGYETQAIQSEFAASSASKLGNIGVGASLLGGASQVAGAHQQFKTAES